MVGWGRGRRVERGGRIETLSKYRCKLLEIINRLMNFFLNHGLNSLNTAPKPKNIFLMIIEKRILIIYKVIKQLTLFQVLHQQIRLGGGQDLCWSCWHRRGSKIWENLLMYYLNAPLYYNQCIFVCTSLLVLTILSLRNSHMYSLSVSTKRWVTRYLFSTLYASVFDSLMYGS